MEKTKLSQILGHQLKGIMLHTDLCKAYMLRGNTRCASKHYCHTLGETKNFLLTNKVIIEELKEIVEPTKETQAIIPSDATDEKLFEMWQTWERETLALWQEAIIAEPECKWWKRLYQATKNEIHYEMDI